MIEAPVSVDAKTEYSVGYKESALACMRSRSAENCCRFLRSYVQRDSRILDCGCGPGSITTGLARWAPDGQTIGIDVSGEQLEGARALARELGVDNVSFREASVFELPFEDGSFDLVFSQAMFCHITNHDQALAEIKRVLRPGGIVSIRDVVSAFVVVWPDEPLIREVQRLFRLGQQRSGGNPDIGRELGALLHRAGFRDVFLTFSFDQPQMPEERTEYFALRAALLESSDLATLAVREGWTTPARLAQAISRWRGLVSDPGSISAVPFGEAVGRKPA